MSRSAVSSDADFVTLADGGRIAYAVHGKSEGARPPLLLLRPLGGSMALWDAGGFREHLAAQRQVVSFDPRGAGRSSRAPLFTTTRKMAADAIAVLDHLDLGSADLFGLSLGGMVAMFVAIDAPQRVRRIILGSTARRGMEVSRHGLGRALSLGQCLLRPTMADVEACLLRRILSTRFRREHPGAVQRLERLIRAAPASRAGLLTLAAAAALHDASAYLSRVFAPALILWGELDPLLRADSELALARALPDARLEVIRDSGHDLSLEQPLATADCIRAFLAP